MFNNLALSLLAFLFSISASVSHAACIEVKDDPELNISLRNMTALNKLGLDRSKFFKVLHYTSLSETRGCWAEPTGNFDDQYLSAGVLQWNFAQGSIQPLLETFRTKLRATGTFDAFLNASMPVNGRAIFATCLGAPVKQKVSSACSQVLLEPDGKRTKPSVLSEMETLFNLPEMRQIQLDTVLTTFTGVSEKIAKLSKSEAISGRKIAWAFDIVVQQGALPSAANVERVRQSFYKRDAAGQRDALLNILAWYEASCKAIDQGSCWGDYEHNVATWGAMIRAGLTAEKADLILLTYMRSRTATGQSGRWQALSFQRRAAIVMGTGKLSGSVVSFEFDNPQ